MSHLECGSVVWVRLGQAWWPGTVTTMAKCPPEFVQGIRKMPLSIVKFFHENEFQDVHKAEHIYPYDCERKEEFIKKGQYINKNQSHGDVDLLAKFEADVVTAEKLTGGDMNILQTMGEVAGKRRIDYSDLGFGPPKPKKKKEDMIKRGSDIGQAVVYKKVGIRSAGNKLQRVVIEHKVRILEQPRKENMAQDMREASNWYKCYSCGYTCSRLNVIIWHNKAHINKVCNYDTGIKVPGRRKRKQGTPRTNKEMRKKAKEAKGKENLEHAHTNGEVSSPKKDSQDTQQLLMDWDDEEEDGEGDRSKVLPGGPDKRRNDSDDGYSDNDDYPPPQPKYERRPMPKAADINSAFDALLAATPMTPSSNQTTNYVNNDSDSDYSDWEKYYARDSGSESEEEEVAQESDIKSLCEEKEGITGRSIETTPKEESNDIIECKMEEADNTGDEHKPDVSTSITEEEETKRVDVVDHGNSPIALTPEPEEPVKLEEPKEPEEPKPEMVDRRLTPPIQYFNTNDAKDEVQEAVDEPKMVEQDCSDNIQTELSSESLEESREPLDSTEESRMEVDQPFEMREDGKESESDCRPAEAEDYYHDTESSVKNSSQPAERIEEKITQRVEPKIVQKVELEKEERESVEEEVVSDVEDNPSSIHSSRTRLESGSENIAEPTRVSDVTTSSGSGTTYMLVAVDAHGNTVPTVPTPALSEGGSNLVAVEATMEDGTTRTLYIDPSQLGPNVDLNNLMLHIDTSGQEHVIIPSSSSSDSETPSVDHSMSEGQERNFADTQPEYLSEPHKYEQKNDVGAAELEHYEMPQEKEKCRASEESYRKNPSIGVELSLMSERVVAPSGSRNPACVTNEDYISRPRGNKWPEVEEGERVIDRAEAKAEFDTDLGKVRCPHSNNARENVEAEVDVSNESHNTEDCPMVGNGVQLDPAMKKHEHGLLQGKKINNSESHFNENISIPKEGFNSERSVESQTLCDYKIKVDIIDSEGIVENREYQVEKVYSTHFEQDGLQQKTPVLEKCYQSTSEDDFTKENVDKDYSNDNATCENRVEPFHGNSHLTEPVTRSHRHKDALEDKQLENKSSMLGTLEGAVHGFSSCTLAKNSTSFKEIEQSNDITVSHTQCNLKTPTSDFKNSEAVSLQSTNDSINTLTSNMADKVDCGIECSDHSVATVINGGARTEASRFLSDVIAKAKASDLQMEDFGSRLDLNTHSGMGLESRGLEKSGKEESNEERQTRCGVDKLKRRSRKNGDCSMSSWKRDEINCRRSERIQGRNGEGEKLGKGNEGKSKPVKSPCQQQSGSNTEYGTNIQYKKHGIKRQLVKDEKGDLLKRKKCKEGEGNSSQNSLRDTDGDIMDFNDDDDLPDLNTFPFAKDTSKAEIKTHDLLWTLHRGLWWPSYVRQKYSREKKVSVFFIGCDQTVGIRVKWNNTRPFLQDHIPLFVDQSAQGLPEALQLCKSYSNLCEYRSDITPHQFFSLPVEEQDALVNTEATPTLDSSSPSVSKKSKSDVVETPKVRKKQSLTRSSREKAKKNMSSKELTMSARDKRKLKVAIVVRRRENEKLLRYMRSDECMSHLWQIFRGEKASKRHEMYQDEYSRKMLMWSGVGPFHLDEEDEQILEVVDFLHKELCSKRQDFVMAHDYALRVWMPEAIKEALRVVRKVPESELESALDTGYRETQTEKKARRLDFSAT